MRCVVRRPVALPARPLWGALVLVAVLAAPAAAEDAVDAVDVYAGTGCLFDGVHYKPGQAVAVKDEPCVKCRCRRGAPVCRLRVCAPLPDPPPPGCVLLHRAHACCPQLHCPETGPVDNRLETRHGQPLRYRADIPNKGCYLNGSLFAEGSALSSSTLCDYCYCVRGQQRCVRPQCVLPAPGCRPEYRDHTCCPTSYHCGGGGGGGDNATTTARPRRRVSGCTVDGKRYREGAQVKSVARGQCETCFCMRGQVRCAPLKCDLPLDGCLPVTLPGKCCPVSYDCSKSRVSVTKTVTSASSHHNSKGPSTRPTKGENSVRSISYDARSNREISSTDTSKATLEAEPRERNVLATTQRSSEEILTTLMAGTADNIAVTLNTKLDLRDNIEILKSKNNTILPEKNKILPVIEAIINKTRQKDQDYDYDYNEPSLPPSLPNLRIIPFVAADAVVQEEKTAMSGDQELPESSNTALSRKPLDKIDNFYFFSPPTETEGGFVPRDPIQDGPIYKPNFDSHGTEGGHKISTQKPQPIEVTIRTVVPDAVTPDPLLGNGGSAPCTSGGRRYRHGELLSGMGACRMCFCFDGGVVCQEPSCGAVPPGCSRSPPAADSERCCGSIVCGDENPLLFGDLVEPPPHRVHTPSEVIEPVPALVPSSTVHPTKQPASTTSTTTTTSPAPSSPPTTKSSATTAKPSTTSTTPSTTTTQRKKPATVSTTSVPSTTSPSSTTTTTTTRTTTKTPPKLKPTTPKPTTTTKRPPSKTPTTTLASVKTTAKPTTTTTDAVWKTPTTPMPKTTPVATTPAPRLPTSSPSNKITTSLPKVTTATPAARPKPEQLTKASSPQPLREERPTTKAPSLFEALWGEESDSANEAQDKVDEDVQYTDFVSTNKQEGAASKPAVQPEAEEDDSFSLDKLFEFFMKPDPTTAATPVLSSTVQTTRPPPTSTPRAPTTTVRTTTAASTTPRLRTTSTTMKVSSSATPAPPRKDAKTTTATPPRTTSPKVTTAKKTTTTPRTQPTASSPAAKPAATSRPPPTTTTRRPSPSTTSTTTTTTTTTTTPTPSTTPKPTLRPAVTTTTTVPSTTITLAATPLPAPVRSTLLFGSNKYKPSSYPAQQHHLSTRRPTATPQDAGPLAPGPAYITTTTTRRPDPGLSGLLKLAGCNIYGRMYRVGRIIQELSGPCLECRCTEVGVQCQQLAC